MINSRTLIWFLVGGIWNSANLLLLYLVVKATFSKTRKMGRIILILFLKFPILYTSGYMILIYWNPSFGGLILGFSMPLLAAFIWIIRISSRLLAQPDHSKGALTEGAEYSSVFHNIKGQQG